MKVQLKNEMTLTTKSSQFKFAAKEQVTLSRTSSNDLMIEDAQHNKVIVNDSEIFKAVMENCLYGTATKARAKMALGKLCEEVDPELVADFMAATDQVPNKEAEDGCEAHMDAEEGGLDKLEIEVPVTQVADTSVEQKIDALTEEDEQVVPAELADEVAQSVELVDDAPAFTKDTQENKEGDDVVEAGADPDVKEPAEKPEADATLYTTADAEQMKEEVELAISPDGGITVTQAGGDAGISTDIAPATEEDEAPAEPDMGAAGVDAPVVADPAEEPVITEDDEESEDDKDNKKPAVLDPTETATC